MNLKESQIKVIEMLARNEEAVSKLYKAYAEKFPNYESFWSRLAEEEIEHACWIRKLHSKIKEGSVYFNEGRFKIEAIQTSLDYLNDWLVKAQKEEISLINALSLAWDIENALMERKYFEIFEGDSVELKHVLTNLADSTKDHRDRVKRALDENR